MTTTYHKVHQHNRHEEKEDEEQHVDIRLECAEFYHDEVITELYLSQCHHEDIQYCCVQVLEYRLTRKRCMSKDETL